MKYSNNELRVACAFSSLAIIVLLPVEIPLTALFAIFSKKARARLVKLCKIGTRALPAIIRAAARGTDDDYAAFVAVGDDLFGGQI